MNVLVTGTSGLIGGYIYSELKKTSLHNVFAASRELLPDLADSNTSNLLEKLGTIDIIIHCAAKIPVPGTAMGDAAETNKKIDLNIFKYCKKNDTKVIFMSGMSVYAQYGQNVIIDETMPLLTNSETSSYFQEKVNSELLFMELSGTVVLRVSSPYGQTQKNSNVLKIFTENVKQNNDICYHGTGGRTQDFVHGLDIASAVSCALRQSASGIFNIVSGEPISMKQLAFLIASLSPSYTGKIHSNNLDDLQENFRANFSNERANKILGWKPIISLSTGISELL